jgi:hypothetical protein
MEEEPSKTPEIRATGEAGDKGAQESKRRLTVHKSDCSLPSYSVEQLQREDSQREMKANVIVVVVVVVIVNEVQGGGGGGGGKRSVGDRSELW